jgi:hypothetical protein
LLTLPFRIFFGLLFGLLLLPFTLLFLPFLLLRAVFKLALLVFLAPFIVLVTVGVLLVAGFALVFALLLPLLPFAFVGLIIWAIVRAGVRAENLERCADTTGHSVRSTRFGSVRPARCAGMRPAAAETTANNRTVAPAIAGSCG